MEFRSILGPYDVLRTVGSIPVPLVTIDYEKVRGALLSAVVEDSIGVSGIAVINSVYVADIEISGLIQGQEDLLKKGYIRSFMGPMVYHFPDDAPYQSIVIRGRNMAGGKIPDPNLTIMLTSTTTTRDPQTGQAVSVTTPDFTATLTISIQARREARRV